MIVSKIVSKREVLDFDKEKIDHLNNEYLNFATK